MAAGRALRLAMVAFDDRFDQLWSEGYRVAFRVLGDREAAADVAQETLVRVAERWNRVGDYASAFTAKVAGDRAIDVWRRREAAPAARRPDERGTVSFEERSELVEALRRLPERQRQVVVLRYLGDVSQRETARVLGCSEGAVTQHASRGLAALRIILAPTQTGA